MTVTDAATVAQLTAIDAAQTGTGTLSYGSIEDAAANIVDADGTNLSGFVGADTDVTVTGTSATAAQLNTIDTAITSAVDAVTVNTITGTTAAVNALDTAVEAGTVVLATNYSISLDVGQTATVAEVNNWDATNGTGEITAVISDGGTSDLVQLTGTHAYTITVTDLTAAATDLITITEATSLEVTATNVTTVTGTESELLALALAVNSDEINVASDWEGQGDFGAAIDYTVAQIGELATSGLNVFNEVGGDDAYTISKAQYDAFATGGIKTHSSDTVSILATGQADVIASTLIEGTLKVTYSTTEGSPAATMTFQEDAAITDPELDNNDYFRPTGGVDVLQFDTGDVIDLVSYGLTSQADNATTFTGTGTKLGNAQWAVLRGDWDDVNNQFNYNDSTGSDVLVLWDADVSDNSSQVGVVIDNGANTDFYVQTAVGNSEDPLSGASLITF